MIGPSDELLCMSAITDAKLWFLHAVLDAAIAFRAANPVDGSFELDDEELDKLRTDAVTYIAELFFLIKDTDLREPRDLEAYFERHNEAVRAKLAALDASGSLYTKDGLSRSRIVDGILSEDQIQTILDEAEDGRLQFSQNALGCLLIDAMAAETCRTTIGTLVATGFLKKRGEKSIRVRSTGVLERLYKEHLRMIIDRVARQEVYA